MSIEGIVTELRAEEARINTAIALLTSQSVDEFEQRKAPQHRGRVAVDNAKPKRKKGGLTPEGRRRLALAMKRRWAERRKEKEALATQPFVKKVRKAQAKPKAAKAKRPAQKKAVAKKSATATAAATT